MKSYTHTTTPWRHWLPGCLLLILGGSVYAADVANSATLAAPNAMATQLEAHRGKPGALAPTSLFQPTSQSATQDAATRNAVSSGTLLNLDTQAIQRLQQTQPRSITLNLPTRERGLVELELVANDIFAPDFKIEASGGESTKAIKRGLHYRGIVKGDPQSVAAISVFDHEIMGTFSTPTDGNWVIGRLENQARGDRHIIYAESSLLDTKGAPTCSTPDTGARRSFAEYWPEQPAATAAAGSNQVSVGNAVEAIETVKCATEWLEAEYDMFQNRGSLQATSDFMTGVFNNSSTIYANDGITLRLSQLYVWTTPDPYNGGNSTDNLSSFQNNRSGNFNGTIAQLLTFRSLGGGVAAGFSGICNASRSASMCTSGINTSYSNVPTYSWTVSVVTHEAGHLLGSRHTHACVWNGNNSAIDSCSGFTEGGCAMPGNPSGGGTIMSYCHLTNVGINFNKGFGSQPATTIRNRVEGGGCLGNCSPGGGSATPLQNYNPANNIAGAANAQLMYKIDVPAGTQALSFNTWGGSGDADIYVKQGSQPTTTSATCQSTSPSNSEVCRINNPVAGTWYVLVHAYSAIANFNLAASFTSGCTGTLEFGALTGAGTEAFLPNSAGYVSSTVGTHRGVSGGPSNADFELELQRWSGSAWLKVAEGITPTSAETVQYANGAPSSYRWRPYAYSGSGGYSVCYSRPN